MQAVCDDALPLSFAGRSRRVGGTVDAGEKAIQDDQSHSTRGHSGIKNRKLR